jgi:hypothetical protein
MTARELGRVGKRVTILREQMRRAHPSASGCGVRMFGGGLRRIRPWRGALRAAALSQRISSTVPGLVSFKSTVRGSRENLNIKPINCHPCSV